MSKSRLEHGVLVKRFTGDMYLEVYQDFIDSLDDAGVFLGIGFMCRTAWLSSLKKVEKKNDAVNVLISLADELFPNCDDVYIALHARGE